MAECKIKGCRRTGLTERELEIHMKYFHGIKDTTHEQPQKMAAGICPDCGGTLFYQEGCALCQSCGFSKCE